MSKIALFVLTYLGLDSLAFPVLAHSSVRLWLVSISDEGSLPEITLLGASVLKLQSHMGTDEYGGAGKSRTALDHYPE